MQLYCDFLSFLHLKHFRLICREGKKKQNCKCVRYSVDGESRVFLVATRDISKGEKLYYNYNGYENQYPTHNFV
jgi:SET domain-containing protein